MIKTQPILLLAAALGGCTHAAAAAPGARLEPLPIGSAVAMGDVPMPNVDGKPVTIAGSKGDKGTLVVFTCNHCPWAKAWQDRIVALGNRFTGEGVGVLAVNPNDPTAYPEDGAVQMKERAAELGMKFPYVVDAGGKVARAFGATKTPEVFLFDAAGKLVYYGAVDDNANDPAAVEHKYLEDALTALVAGQPIPKASTKALGCSIKYPS